MSNTIYAFDVEEYANNTKDKIIIDAGHTIIGSHDGKYFFGKTKKGPSESEILTLQYGLQIADKLTKLGKQSVVHLCFSDTSKNFTSLQARQKVKKLIEEEKFRDILPIPYRELTQQYQDVNIRYTLQTKLSNVATAKLKKLKKRLRSLKDPKIVYEETGAVFVCDLAKDSFGLFHSFLFDYAKENETLGSDWWLDEMSHLHPMDLVEHPFLQAKKNGKILLYSKASGILCPGTFSGVLFNLDPGVDFMSIYSREDDPDIGEKVIGGVIAALSTFEKLDCRCTQLILTGGNDEWEVSTIEPEMLKNRQSWEAFRVKLEERGFLEKFCFYE